MNKFILSGMIFAAAGFGIGYYFGRYFRHEEVEKEIADSLVDLKKHYKKRLREMEVKYRESAKEMGIVITDEPHPLANHSETESEKNPQVEKPKTKTEYHRISKRPKPTLKEERELAENEYPKEEYDFSVNDGSDWPEPYNISEDEYHGDHDWYDKRELTYYVEDDTLLGEEEEILPDVLDRVGAETYQMMIEAEKDLVYARDESISTDYEIQIVRGSFGEETI